MAIDAVSVGQNQRPVMVVGDPVTASNLAQVPLITDGIATAGLFGAMAAAVGYIKNPLTGNLEVARASPGITGIPAVSTEGTKSTYCCGTIGFLPVATPTDIWSIFGSGSKTIRLVRLEISSQATSAATVEIQLIRRSTANSGGSPTAQTAIYQDFNNAAATAAVNLYTANPTLGTAVGTVRGGKLNLGAAGAAGLLTWDFGTRNSQGLVLRGVGQGLAINWNGAAVPSGTLLCISAEWVEDAS